MNLATAIILLGVIICFIIAVRKIIKDKKKGCGCGCSGCSGCNGCSIYMKNKNNDIKKR